MEVVHKVDGPTEDDPAYPLHVTSSRTRLESEDSRHTQDSKGENSEITYINTQHNSNSRFTTEGDNIRRQTFKPIHSSAESLASLESNSSGSGGPLEMQLHNRVEDMNSRVDAENMNSRVDVENMNMFSGGRALKSSSIIVVCAQIKQRKAVYSVPWNYFGYFWFMELKYEKGTITLSDLYSKTIF